MKNQLQAHPIREVHRLPGKEEGEAQQWVQLE